MSGRRGRNKYHTHVEPKLLLIEAWARDGLIDEDIARKLGVATIMVETKRVTNEVQPDVTAQLLWLKIRPPEVWRDKKGTRRQRWPA